MVSLMTELKYDMETWIKDEYKDEYELFSHFYNCMLETNYVFDLISDVKNENNSCELYQAECEFLNLQNPFREVPPKLNSENGNFKNVCSTVDLITTVDGFRYVQARKTLICGLVIACEKPQILFCKPNCMCLKKPSHHCHYCGTILTLFEICENCEMCVYCDKTCMNKALNEYHKWECDGMRHHYWRDMPYFAMRMLFMEISTKFNKEASNIHNNDNNADPPFSGLPGNIEDKSKKELSIILKGAVRTLIYLIERTDIFKMIMKHVVFPKRTLFECYMEIGCQLVRNQCKAIKNVIFVSQYNSNLKDLNAAFSYKNKALCISLNAFNHNCKPNAILFPVDNYIVAKTLRKIKCGEEISINYYDTIDSFVHYMNIRRVNPCTCCSCLKDVKYDDAYKCVTKKCNGVVLQSTLTCTKCNTKRSSMEINKLKLDAAKLRIRFYNNHDYSGLDLAIKTYESFAHKYNINLANLYMEVAYYLTTKRITKSYLNFMSALSIYEQILPKFSLFLLKKKLDYAYSLLVASSTYNFTDESELQIFLKVLLMTKGHLKYFHMSPKLFSLNFDIIKIREKLKNIIKLKDGLPNKEKFE